MRVRQVKGKKGLICSPTLGTGEIFSKKKKSETTVVWVIECHQEKGSSALKEIGAEKGERETGRMAILRCS